MEANDPCARERQQLEKALKDLQDHRSNPLGWNTAETGYKERLSALQDAVDQAKSALKECEASQK